MTTNAQTKRKSIHLGGGKICARKEAKAPHPPHEDRLVELVQMAKIEFSGHLFETTESVIGARASVHIVVYDPR